MERHLLERMIGAAVLLVALVVIVPAILDGRPDVEDTRPAEQPDPASTASDAPLRQHTIRLDRPAERPPIAQRARDKPPSAATIQAPAAKSDAVAEARPTPEPASDRASEPEPAATSSPAPEPAPAQPQTQPAPEPSPVIAKTPDPQPSARESAASASGWIVQLGSFSNRANAERLAERTRAKGFETYLIPIERSGKTLFRVRVGPARKTRGEAARLAEDLRKAGFEGQVAEQRADG